MLQISAQTRNLWALEARSGGQQIDDLLNGVVGAVVEVIVREAAALAGEDPGNVDPWWRIWGR